MVEPRAAAPQNRTELACQSLLGAPAPALRTEAEWRHYAGGCEIAARCWHQPTSCCLDEASAGLDAASRSCAPTSIFVICVRRAGAYRWSGPLTCMDEVDLNDPVIVLHSGVSWRLTKSCPLIAQTRPRQL